MLGDIWSSSELTAQQLGITEIKLSFLMVSVVDSEIHVETTFEELLNSGNWYKGWINLPKLQSITEEYVDYKFLKNGESIGEIFINEDSIFNIS